MRFPGPQGTLSGSACAAGQLLAYCHLWLSQHFGSLTISERNDALGLARDFKVNSSQNTNAATNPSHTAAEFFRAGAFDDAPKEANF